MSEVLAEAASLAQQQKQGVAGRDGEGSEEISGIEGDWARVCAEVGWQREGRARETNKTASMLGRRLLRICDKVSEDLDPWTEK